MEHLSPGDALSRLKQLIKNGKYGINYTFVPTDKNKLLVETYYFDDKKRIDVLLSLESTDYIKDEYSNNPDNLDDYMYVFIKRGVLLMPRFYEVPTMKKVDIYVKFFFGNDKNSFAVILSLHKAGDY
jgi:hypothetical protein